MRVISGILFAMLLIGCGQASSDSEVKVTDGERLDDNLKALGNFPFVARLKIREQGSNTVKTCTGSFIDAHHILTAGTCFKITHKGPQVEIRLKTKDGEMKKRLENVHVEHFSEYVSNPSTVAHNLAMITLFDRNKFELPRYAKFFRVNLRRTPKVRESISIIGYGSPEFVVNGDQATSTNEDGIWRGGRSRIASLEDENGAELDGEYFRAVGTNKANHSLQRVSLASPGDLGAPVFTLFKGPRDDSLVVELTGVVSRIGKTGSTEPGKEYFNDCAAMWDEGNRIFVGGFL